MNIDKYIENTKKKTKKAKLPALSTLSPVMPDGGAGIPSFNAHAGADMSSVGMSEELNPFYIPESAKTNPFYNPDK